MKLNVLRGTCYSSLLLFLSSYVIIIFGGSENKWGVRKKKEVENKIHVKSDEEVGE